MYHLFVKSIGAPALIAITVMLASCGGSTQTSSSGAGSFSAGKTVVEGNVSPSGAVSAVFTDSMTGALATAVPSLFNFILPRAEAQTALAGIEVCLQGECTTTDGSGAFMIILPDDDPGGYYEITFKTNDGTMYSAEINIKNNTITSLKGVLLQENGQVKITGVAITVAAPKDSEDEPSEDEPTEDEPVKKTVVCHKPGTPAQKNLVLPASAIPAHINHGDSEGGCDIEF